MSKEKQLEEIARILSSNCGDCQKCEHYRKEVNGVDSCYFKYAEMVYNAGYRKQIKGEWNAVKQHGQYGYYCTNCKSGFVGETAEWIAKEHDYCPKCGAIMSKAEL